MKANEAPEKIYVTPHFERRWFTKEIDYASVEYTRTDVFIEKVCEFLKDRVEHDSIDYPMATKHLVEDFKKYMEC